MSKLGGNKMNWEEIELEAYRKKYKTLKQIERRLATLEKQLERQHKKMYSIRPDERTQRKVAIHAKWSELAHEKLILLKIKEERE